MKTCFTRAICTVVMAGTLSPAAELYVAPDGNDTNPGTRAAPLKTLEAARDAIRNLKGEQPQLAGGATAWLRGGVYRITKTFELDERDSGTRFSSSPFPSLFLPRGRPAEVGRHTSGASGYSTNQDMRK